MHLPGGFGGLPGGNYFSEGAQMNYVGIDHHRQYSHLTLVDQEGQVLRSGRIPNIQADLLKDTRGRGLFRDEGQPQVADSPVGYGLLPRRQ
jgi:hypothetical protein